MSRHLIATLSLLLVGCQSQPTTPPVLSTDTLYHETFTAPHAWLTYESEASAGSRSRGCWNDPQGVWCVAALRTRGGEASSAPPRWLDANHSEPGAGYLHLLAFAYGAYGTYAGYPPIWTDTTDLRGTEWTVEYRTSPDWSPNGGRIVFWFQNAYLEPGDGFAGYHAYNFALDRDLPPTGGQWQRRLLVLAPDPALWTCLGSRPELAFKYGCADPVSEVSRFSGDLGFVLLGVNPNKEARGSFELREVTVTRPAH